MPPSFYYNGFFGDFYNSWIPTDLFYASPDYDLVPDLYVSRIPFSSPENITHVVDKIMEWYNTTIPSSRKLFMSGGYPFVLSLMFGETALSTMVFHGSTKMFDTNMLTRTSFNYNRSSVLDILMGNRGALWYFALSHGSGDALMDAQIINVDGTGYITLELLASKYDLLYAPHNPAVPIVSSVACMNAAWDTELISPPYFTPPSFGESVLLSPAGGIAYIGSARVAYELFFDPLFIVNNGLLLADYYGATYLHEQIIKAYSDLMGTGSSTTLGEVVARGIAYYLSNVPIIDDYVLGEAMKLSLLGDSALILPLFNESYTNQTLYSASAQNPDIIMSPMVVDWYASGTMPFYKISTPGNISVAGGDGVYSVRVLRLIKGPYYLPGYTSLIIDTMNVANYTGYYIIKFNKSVSGLILAKLGAPGWGEIRVIMGATGVYITPKYSIAGSNILIEGYGLDAVGASAVDIVVAGRVITTGVPVEEGYLNWTMALPYLAPGSYPVALLPQVYLPPELTVGIENLFREYVMVYDVGALSIISQSPAIAEPSDNVVLDIMVLYNGRPVNASLTASVEGPSGPLGVAVSLVGEGKYQLSFPATEPGVYKVSLSAVFVNETLKASGKSSIVLTITKDLYSGLTDLKDLALALNRSLDINFNAIVRELRIINGTQVEIKTSLGDIKGVLLGVKDNVATILTDVGTIKIDLGNVKTTVEDTNSKVTGLIDTASTISSKINTVNQNLQNGFNQQKPYLEKIPGIANYSLAAAAMATLAFIAAILVIALGKKK